MARTQRFIPGEGSQMRRSAKIAVSAIAIYVALSVAAGVLMARVDACIPMRLPLPAKARIAAHVHSPMALTCSPCPFKPPMVSNSCLVLRARTSKRPGSHSASRNWRQSRWCRWIRSGVPAPGLSHSVARFACSRRVGWRGGNLRPARKRRYTPVGYWLVRYGASCVDGFGESMGAALVLESLRSGSRFCAVVAESSFLRFPQRRL